MRRPEVGRWFFDVQYRGYDYIQDGMFTKTIFIDALKLKHQPPEAIQWRHGIDYDGMRFHMKFKWPVSIVSWR